LGNEIGLGWCPGLGFDRFESSGLQEKIWTKRKFVWTGLWSCLAGGVMDCQGGRCFSG